MPVPEYVEVAGRYGLASVNVESKVKRSVGGGGGGPTIMAIYPVIGTPPRVVVPMDLGKVGIHNVRKLPSEGFAASHGPQTIRRDGERGKPRGILVAENLAWSV